MASHEDFHNNDDDRLPHMRFVNVDDFDTDPDKGLYQDSLDVPYDSGIPARHVRMRMHKIPKGNGIYVIPRQTSTDTSNMALHEPPIFGERAIYKHTEDIPQPSEPKEEEEDKVSASAAIAANRTTTTTATTTTASSATAPAATGVWALLDANVAMMANVDSGAGFSTGFSASSGANSNSSVSSNSNTNGSAKGEDSAFKAEGTGEEEEHKEEEVVIKLNPLAIDHDLIDEDGDVIDVPFMDLLSLVGQYVQRNGYESLVEAKSNEQKLSPVKTKLKSKTTSDGSGVASSGHVTKPFLDLDSDGSDSALSKRKASTTVESATFSLTAKATEPIPLTPVLDSKLRSNSTKTYKSKSDTKVKDVLNDFLDSIDAQINATPDSASQADKSALSVTKHKSKTKAKLR